MKSGESGEFGEASREGVAEASGGAAEAAAPLGPSDTPEITQTAGIEEESGEVRSEAGGAEDAAPSPSTPPPVEHGTDEQMPPALAEPRRELAPMGLVALVGVLFALTGLAMRAPPASTLPSVATTEVTSAAPLASSATPPPAPSSTAELADAGPPYTPKWRVAQLKDDESVVVAEGGVGKRPLVASLQQAGLSKAEALRVAKAFEEAHKERPRARDSFVVARDKASGRVTAAEIATSPADVWQAKDSDGKLAFAKLELLVERRPVKAALIVKDDLAQAARDAGLGDDFLRALEDALDGHVDQGDLKKGARLRVVAIEERIERSFAHYPRIDAVELAPPRGAKSLRVYFYERDHDGEGKRRADRGAGYYDAKGQRPYRGQWRSPVPLARVTSRFNPHRLHPVLKVVMPHNGVDFGAGTGTPVYATAPGTVKSVGDGGPCGNMVQIDHPGGLTTAYCHLSRFAPGIHAGQHVEGRTLVGYVGQTGRVTGPHLHFAVKRGDTFIDPLAMKLDGVKTLPTKDRSAFQKVREARDAELDAIAHGDAAPTSEVDGGDDEVISDTVDDDAGRP